MPRLPRDRGSELERAFSRPAVRALAGPRTFERGEDYAAGGLVKSPRITDSAADASVQGSHPYQVHLWVVGGDPHFSCSCPVGSEGAFCKHAVALALVATSPDTAGQRLRAKAEVDVGSYLGSLDRAELVRLVTELAATSDAAATHLRLEAARKDPTAPSDPAFIAAIDIAFAPDDVNSYRDLYHYFRRIEATVATLRQLLEDGQAEMVIRLAEHALERAEDAAQSVDDSNGEMRDIADALQEIHLAACRRAQPDPVELAAHLFDWELHSGDLDVFAGAAKAYASVLGGSGAAAYLALAEAAWARFPPLAPGDKGSFDSARFRVTNIMETLAGLSGDVDQLVAVLEKDLSSPYQFCRIADQLRAAGRFPEALSWAERGLQCFGAKADERLVSLATDEYHRAGQSERAVELAWAVFDADPCATTYRRLKPQATRAGSWHTWRQRALDRLRQSVADRIQQEHAESSTGRAKPHWRTGADGSDLVEVFLFEDDSEQAWKEAQAHGCSAPLWLALARRREADHPLDAIPIFQDQVERLIDQMNNQSYEEAVQLIGRIIQLMAQTTDPEAVQAYLAAVRARHRRKRNLIKLLDARKW